MEAYPIKFYPIFKEKVWGGQNLKRYFNKNIPPDVPIGESWDISDRPGDITVVSNGAYKGKDLHWLCGNFGEDLLGEKFRGRYRFPLIVKFLDPNDKLSIQVHPTEEYVRQHPEAESAKNEMWYVAYAEEEAEIILGLKANVTRDVLQKLIEKGEIETILRRIPVKTGDSFFIPEGTVHSLMPGSIIIEIQQNSDTTFRLYDWNRRGLNGKLRELHLREGLETIVFQKDFGVARGGKPKVKPFKRNKKCCISEKLIECELFRVEKIVLRDSDFMGRCYKASFQILTAVEGEANIYYRGKCKVELSEPLSKGESALLPACLGNYIVSAAGKCVLLRTLSP